MNSVYLLLGSNINDRQKMIRLAIDEISSRVGTIGQSSSLYESEPWGFTADQDFLNQVIRVETMLSPTKLLEEILDIEISLGRTRMENEQGYASRSIDIDILFYNNEIIREEHLDIPHPKIHERLFTLVPLCELDESFIHPVHCKSLGELMAICPDKNAVVPYKV